MERLGVAGLLVGLLPGLVSAQRVTITPLAGFYVGVSRLPDAVEMYYTSRPGPGGNAVRRQRVLPSAFVGLSVLTETNGIGFEASLGAALSRLREWYVEGEPLFQTEGTSLTATTVAALRLVVIRPLGSGSVMLGAGAALTRLRRNDWPGDAAVAGPSVAARVRVPAGGGFFELGATQTFYMLENRTERRLQQDMVLAVGFTPASRQ